MRTTDNQSVIITRPLSEVEALLQQTLSKAELEAVSARAEPPKPDPLKPERHGEVESIRVVVEFVGLAVAGGITYDVIKKITLAAIAKFGAKDVK